MESLDSTASLSETGSDITDNPEDWNNQVLLALLKRTMSIEKAKTPHYIQIVSEVANAYNKSSISMMLFLDWFQALSDIPNKEIGRAVAYALGNFKLQNKSHILILDLLRKLAKNKDPEIKRISINSLGRLQASSEFMPYILEILYELAEEKSTQTRFAIAYSFQNLNIPKKHFDLAWKTIQLISNDRNLHIIKIVAKSISRLNIPQNRHIAVLKLLMKFRETGLWPIISSVDETLLRLKLSESSFTEFFDNLMSPLTAISMHLLSKVGAPKGCLNAIISQLLINTENCEEELLYEISHYLSHLDIPKKYADKALQLIDKLFKSHSKKLNCLAVKFICRIQIPENCFEARYQKLITSSKSNSEFIRREIARNIRFIKYSKNKTLKYLFLTRKLLNDEDQEVKLFLISSFKKFQIHESFFNNFLEMVKNFSTKNNEPEELQALIISLSEMSIPKKYLKMVAMIAQSLIPKLLQNEDIEIHTSALRSLFKLLIRSQQYNKAIKLLDSWITAGYEELIADMTRILGQEKIPQDHIDDIVAVLNECLSLGSEQVCTAIITTLRQFISDKPNIKSCFTLLISLANHTGHKVRSASILALGEIKHSPQNIKKSLALLKHSSIDKEKLVRTAVITVIDTFIDQMSKQQILDEHYDTLLQLLTNLAKDENSSIRVLTIAIRQKLFSLMILDTLTMYFHQVESKYHSTSGEIEKLVCLSTLSQIINQIMTRKAHSKELKSLYLKEPLLSIIIKFLNQNYPPHSPAKSEIFLAFATWSGRRSVAQQLIIFSGLPDLPQANNHLKSLCKEMTKKNAQEQRELYDHLKAYLLAKSKKNTPFKETTDNQLCLLFNYFILHLDLNEERTALFYQFLNINTDFSEEVVTYLHPLLLLPKQQNEYEEAYLDRLCIRVIFYQFFHKTPLAHNQATLKSSAKLAFMVHFNIILAGELTEIVYHEKFLALSSAEKKKLTVSNARALLGSCLTNINNGDLSLRLKQLAKLFAPSDGLNNYSLKFKNYKNEHPYSHLILICRIHQHSEKFDIALPDKFSLYFNRYFLKLCLKIAKTENANQIAFIRESEVVQNQLKQITSSEKFSDYFDGQSDIKCLEELMLKNRGEPETKSLTNS